MIVLTIRPSGGSELERKLDEVARKTGNIPGMLKVMGTALKREQDRRFQYEEAPDGSKWKRLAPLTVAIRGSSGPVLRRSGNLMRSGSYQVSGTTLRVGVNTIYAGVQQFGATIRPKKGKALAIPMGPKRGGRNSKGIMMLKKVVIPPRPIVGFGPKDERAARAVLDAWLAAPP